MDRNYGPSGMDGIYWIELDQEILSDIQKDHKECRPFYIAVDLEPDKMSCELLIRTRNKIRCRCIHYATEAQRNWIIQRIDAIFEENGIIT